MGKSKSMSDQYIKLLGNLDKKPTPEFRKAWNAYLNENRKLLQHKDKKNLIKIIALWLFTEHGVIDMYQAQDKALEFMIRNDL